MRQRLRAALAASLLAGSGAARAVPPLAVAPGRVTLAIPQRVAGPPGSPPETVRSLLVVRGPLRYGQYVWNDRAVPAGPRWIRVDLGRQLLSLFRGGHEIGTAVILYGADGKPTPRGRFTVLARAEHHRSSLYDAAMPYTMTITRDGVAIHGSNVRERAATHGCIGVPTGFARLMFAQVRVGDPVSIG